LKILVCIKQVPQKDAPLKLNESGTWIREDVSYEVNEPDAYALEEALRQKEKHGGEVVVITAGPARSQQVLREALAKGADRSTRRRPLLLQSKTKNSTSSLPGCNRMITGLHRLALFSPSCWGGRTRPSLCRLKRAMAASK
jgi:hypothetical protein